MTPRPTLAELALDPRRANDLEPDAIPALLAQCSAVIAALSARAMETANGTGGEADQPDKLLDARTLADRLNVGVDYVYSHAAGWPFTVRQGRTVRFSERGLERWLRRRQGR